MSGRVNNQRSLSKLCDCFKCPTTRYFVTFMLFLGMVNSYVLRTNMTVAIVAMVNHTAIGTSKNIKSHICPEWNDTKKEKKQDGEHIWDDKVQNYVLASFFYGYVLTQIPCGVLARKYGALNFLGWGMLLNSVFSFFIPLATDRFGAIGLSIVRFLQGVCESPLLPCSHTLLAKWIPPNERSRMCATVYAGAQFGTIVSLPISGILSEYNFAGGWPSIFYIFGSVSLIWSVVFLLLVHEDPRTHPKMNESEKKFIIQSIWDEEDENEIKSIPYSHIFKSFPFYAILGAHMAQNFGYETLIAQLPKYLKHVLNFSIKANGIYFSLPFMAMWFFSIVSALFADWMIMSKRLSTTATRRVMNTVGQYGAGLALVAVSFADCSRVISVLILTAGVGLNGAIYSGFMANHLDLSPRFAGLLMAITNCLANLFGFLAPLSADQLAYKYHSVGRWRIVFFIAAGIYALSATFFNFFALGEKQWWDTQRNDATLNEQEK